MFIKKLPKYSFPGSYPLAYLHDSHNVLCAECANEKREEDEEADLDPFVNEENSSLYCDGCEERIEEAYPRDQELAS